MQLRHSFLFILFADWTPWVSDLSLVKDSESLLLFNLQTFCKIAKATSLFH